MTSIIRYTLTGIGALLALLVIAVLALLLLVDPEDYRDEIVAALSEETGRPINLEGELGLGVLPCCSLQLGPLAVGNPDGWSEAEFVRADNVELSVQLWPLLTRGELQVGQISLDGLSLNLISRRDGSVNWEFASQTETDTVETQGPGEGAPALAVEGIRVSNANLVYADQQTGDRVELQNVNFATGTISPGESGDVSLSVTALGLLPEPVQLELDGKALLGVDGNQGELHDLSIRLDETNITGHVRLADLQTAAVDFALAVDRLNADRYLGDSSAEAGASDAAATDINETRIDIPVQALRDLRLDGSLDIGELIFSGARLNDVSVTVAANNGQLRLHPLTANLYDGSYAGDVRLDVRGAQPRLSVNEQLSGITLSALLTDMRGAANLSGSGNVGIKASAGGATVGELLEKLSGDATFDLSDGIYKGIDIWYEIRKARALLKKAAPPDKPAEPQTELSEFSGTLQFSGGQVQNRDFQAALPFMRLTGSGSFNLLSTAMNYTLRARVVETPTFGEGEDLDKLEGLTLPIRVTGSADNPKVKVDLGDMARDAAKEKVREKAREKFEDKLRGLFD